MGRDGAGDAKRQIRTVSIDALHERFSYDPESGVLIRKISTCNSNSPGDIAGHQRPRGEIRVGVLGKLILAHRIIWAMMTGLWPTQEIDHIDGNPANNKWCNLREATPLQNQGNKRIYGNNKSGMKGIAWNGTSRSWCAYIGRDYKTIYLGSFRTKEEAHAAYLSAAQERFGEFARG